MSNDVKKEDLKKEETKKKEVKEPKQETLVDLLKRLNYDREKVANTLMKGDNTAADVTQYTKMIGMDKKGLPIYEKHYTMNEEADYHLATDAAYETIKSIMKDLDNMKASKDGEVAIAYWLGRIEGTMNIKMGLRFDLDNGKQLALDLLPNVKGQFSVNLDSIEKDYKVIGYTLITEIFYAGNIMCTHKLPFSFKDRVFKDEKGNDVKEPVIIPIKDPNEKTIRIQLTSTYLRNVYNMYIAFMNIYHYEQGDLAEDKTPIKKEGVMHDKAVSKKK